MEQQVGDTHKFMQTLTQKQWDELQQEARKRGTTVQDLIRIIIVPAYVQNRKNHQQSVRKKIRERAR